MSVKWHQWDYVLKILQNHPASFFSPHPFPKILRRNGLDFGIWVSVRKRLGDAAFLFGVPLEFERLDFWAADFKVVHFHLVSCPPKIRESIGTAVGVPFHAFADSIILPKCPDVVPLRHGRKIVQYGVADSVIPEVILDAFLDFVAQVVRIRRKRENDKLG